MMSLYCNSTGIFVALTSGVFLCFLINGIVNEAIFKIVGFNEFGWFLTFIQFLFYVFLSGCHLWKSNKATIFTFSSSLIRLSIFNVIAMGLTNASAGRMNYPTQLMFKSCKVISVMAAGILLRGKRYRFIDFIAIILMTFGLILFTLADVTVSPEFQAKGVIMVIGAVLMDGIVGIYQEDLTQKKNIEITELIFKTYLIGSLFIFVYLWTTGEMKEASYFCFMHWTEILPLFCAFSMTGYLGVFLILKMIEKHGALSAVIVTTSRKAITIVLSFILFNKPFSNQYIWSSLLILIGIYLNGQKTHFQRCNIILNHFKFQSKVCVKWPRSTIKDEWLV